MTVSELIGILTKLPQDMAVHVEIDADVLAPIAVAEYNPAFAAVVLQYSNNATT